MTLRKSRETILVQRGIAGVQDAGICAAWVAAIGTSTPEITSVFNIDETTWGTDVTRGKTRNRMIS